jgi:cyclic pyranopterin phosphate synthase
MDDISLSPQTALRPVSRLADAFGREITYLRLSLTDRCNLRCVYCMGSDVKFLPKADVLSLEEMERLCAAFIRLGVRKVRLTGGEPLLRPGVMGLIDRLGARLASGELDELTLTTNGTLLATHATALSAAGVRRVNVSLDTLDAAIFLQIARRDGLADVLAGIDAACAAGLAVRINVVALAGVNDTEYDRLIGWCGEHGCDLAMIELMPFGGQPHGQYQALDPVRELLAERWTLTPVEKGSGGPCRYWHIAETGRRIGFITPMSHGFCADCNRVRVTCTGRLVPCMARHGDVDLRAALRGSEADDDLEAAIVAAIDAKPEGHQFNVGGAPGGQRMWQLGG